MKYWQCALATIGILVAGALIGFALYVVAGVLAKLNPVCSGAIVVTCFAIFISYGMWRTTNAK